MIAAPDGLFKKKDTPQQKCMQKTENSLDTANLGVDNYTLATKTVCPIAILVPPLVVYRSGRVVR